MKNLITFSNFNSINSINESRENKIPVVLLNVIADLKTAFVSRGFKLIQSSRHYLHFVNELRHNIYVNIGEDGKDLNVVIKLNQFKDVNNRDRWVKHYESIIVPVIKPLYNQIKSESIYVLIDIFGIIIPLHLLDSDAEPYSSGEVEEETDM